MKTYKINYEVSDEVGKLWYRLNSSVGETRAVGGWVRDKIMGVKPKDLDLCTVATPDQLMAFAKRWDYRVEPTGLQHGTVSFIIEGEAYEVTTLRRDTDCDGRHANVEFVTDFAIDASRRDFTMNAMSMNFYGDVYDYFGGYEDIKEGVIKFVGNAEDRIREDYLRVLRFFRFAARFDASMEWNALKFMCTDEVHDGLAKVSRERIWAEVSKIAQTNTTGRESVIAQMNLSGISGAIGMKPNPMASQCMKYANDAPTFMAGFCGLDPVGFGKAWKMSTEETNKMAHVAWSGPFWGPKDMISDMLDGVKPEWIRSCVHIWAPGMAEGDFFDNMIKEMPKFTITGKDLIEEGFAQGPEMGKELAKRRAEWKQDLMKGI